jgi:hypothetical protein
MKFPLGSAEAKTTLSEGIEWPPEQPVEKRYQNAHDAKPRTNRGKSPASVAVAI